MLLSHAFNGVGYFAHFDNMENFKIITRSEAVKRIADFFNAYDGVLQYIGILFETRIECNKFLDEVKTEILKTHSKAKIWNKISIQKYNNGKRILVVNTYNADGSYSEYIPDINLSQIYVDAMCYEKYKNVVKQCIESQSSLKQEYIENFEIVDDISLSDEVDDYTDVKRDFNKILNKLNRLDNDIYNSLIHFEIERNDFDLVYDTREYINKCIKNIKKLSFLNKEN